MCGKMLNSLDVKYEKCLQLKKKYYVIVNALFVTHVKVFWLNWQKLKSIFGGFPQEILQIDWVAS